MKKQLELGEHIKKGESSRPMQHSYPLSRFMGVCMDSWGPQIAPHYSEPDPAYRQRSSRLSRSRSFGIFEGHTIPTRVLDKPNLRPDLVIPGFIRQSASNMGSVTTFFASLVDSTL